MGSKIKRKKESKGPPREKKRKIVPEGVRGIVRIAETDADGMKKVSHSLLKVKGVGQSLAKVITILAKVDPNQLMGKLNEEELKRIEDVIRHPDKYNIPAYLLNRRKDPVDGKDKHVIASELVISRKTDTDRMKKIHSYRGVRHGLGLPVRGQRTRGSFRTGQTAGVMKSKIKAAAKGAKLAAGAPAKEAKPANGKPAKPEAKPEAKKEAKK